MEKYIKTRYNSLLVGIVAILVGMLFVVFNSAILDWAICFVAILSLLAGIVQFFAFLARTKGVENRWRHMPVTSVIAVAWGVLLLVNPKFWTDFFMIVFGLLIIYLAVNQVITLVQTKRSGVVVGWGYFVFPVLFLLSGVTIFVLPRSSATWIMLFIGAWIIAYGIMEMFGYFSLKGADRE